MLCTLLSLATALQARVDEAALKIMEKTVEAVEAAGEISVDFSAAYFNQPDSPDELNGSICVSGKKLYVDSDRAMYWYDGETLWTYIKTNEEVNVSTPTEQEQQSINPYFFIHLYKEGYELVLDGEQTLRGKVCYTLKMTSTDEEKTKIRSMLVDVDEKTWLPVCVRFKNAAGTWIRISILECRMHQKFDDSLFKFDASKYPDLDIIDLR